MARKAKAPSKLNVRLDGELRNQLEEAAAKNGTSLQTEIVVRLQRTFADDDQLIREVEEHSTRLVRLEEWRRLVDIGKPEQKHDKGTDTGRTRTIRTDQEGG